MADAFFACAAKLGDSKGPVIVIFERQIGEHLADSDAGSVFLGDKQSHSAQFAKSSGNGKRD